MKLPARPGGVLLPWVAARVYLAGGDVIEDVHLRLVVGSGHAPR